MDGLIDGWMAFPGRSRRRGSSICICILFFFSFLFLSSSRPVHAFIPRGATKPQCRPARRAPAPHGCDAFRGRGRGLGWASSHTVPSYIFPPRSPRRLSVFRGGEGARGRGGEALRFLGLGSLCYVVVLCHMSSKATAVESTHVVGLVCRREMQRLVWFGKRAHIMHCHVASRTGGGCNGAASREALRALLCLAWLIYFPLLCVRNSR